MNQARESHKLFDAERRLKDAQLLLDTQRESTSKAMSDWEKKRDR
jgi:hypothetical protein